MNPYYQDDHVTLLLGDACAQSATLAYTYAHMLMDESDDWKPPPREQGTAAVLLALGVRAGHFTEHADPLVAFEFAEDVERTSTRAWNVARPSGAAIVPLGIACHVEACTGELRVRIDRDKPLDVAALATWRPTAVCYLRAEDGKWHINPLDHRIDAKLVAHQGGTS